MDFNFDKNHIQNKLKDYHSKDRLTWHHEDFINAAVVFLIIPYENRPYDLVLIKRTKRENDKHSGEMSFPGGKFDYILDKNYLDTALRELNEELGIPHSEVQILGCIDDHLTPKGFIITPFVAYINENQKLIKQDAEVHEIVKIPVNFFANKKNYSEKIFIVKDEFIALGRYEYFSPKNKKYVVFGATAHIIHNFIERVYKIGLMKPRVRRATIDDLKDKIVK